MKFVINGGKKLEGEIAVKGFKNSATPIIAATLLTEQTCLLHNIPKVGDVLTMLEILKSMGSKQRWVSETSLEIQNGNLEPEKLDQSLVNQIRSSILLLGPMLARFRRFRFITPGGCRIGARPIDTHLESIRDLGAKVEFDGQSGIYEISLSGFKTSEIFLKEFSVTATENLLMLGFSRPLTIKLAAVEPHVWDLARFLEKLGAEISFTGHAFSVNPGKNKSGVIEHTIINDPIEAVTLAILAAAVKGKININGIDAGHLEAPLQKLKEFGVVFKIKENVLSVDGLSSVLRSAKVQTLPYPGLPTDLQAPFGVLATQASGASLIFDTLYEGRLKYIDELKKMGAEAVILDSHRALITGPKALHGAKVESLDLRAGATLVIAALIARGESVLGSVEQIDRGYENLDGRLRELGADIQRIS
ncbi:MAG: UDP-N-acetylglucosamine 1-carboxyvinyltransferase [Candidatus Harrisonbacteria bacterium]|nr:UDP-N-acetylglucosamine 1-carboxyvinyltransferase [Candidatus Harrisonbacteria bacterium]